MYPLTYHNSSNLLPKFMACPHNHFCAKYPPPFPRSSPLLQRHISDVDWHHWSKSLYNILEGNLTDINKSPSVLMLTTLQFSMLLFCKQYWSKSLSWKVYFPPLYHSFWHYAKQIHICTYHDLISKHHNANMGQGLSQLLHNTPRSKFKTYYSAQVGNELWNRVGVCVMCNKTCIFPT